MLRLSIDLETLSNKPTAAILEIGIAAIVDQVVVETININLDADDAIRNGHVNGSTLQWWSKQPHFPDMLSGKTKVKHALRDCYNFVQNFRAKHDMAEIEEVWAMPISFDLPILVHACDVTDEVPFFPEFRRWKCLRTLRVEAERLLGLTVERPVPKIAHVAVHDAVAQAEYLFRLENAIRGTTWGRM